MKSINFKITARFTIKTSILNVKIHDVNRITTEFLSFVSATTNKAPCRLQSHKTASHCFHLYLTQLFQCHHEWSAAVYHSYTKASAERHCTSTYGTVRA